MGFEKRLSPDSRLTAIAELVGICDSCADIGTDHGRLGGYLLQTRFCKHVVFTDISAPSLEKARKLITLLGLETYAEFGVGNGFAAIQQTVDSAVIAGMGGETIVSILSSDAFFRNRPKRLVLQPNVDAPLVRGHLQNIGMRITDERIVKNGRRYYTVIAAEQGEMSLSDTEKMIGPFIMKNRTDEFYGYREFRLRVLNKAIHGAECSNNSVSELKELYAERNVWEHVE